jgi:hypothetical protein
MGQRTASWFRSIRASGISSDRLQVDSSSPFAVLDVRSADPDVPQVHHVEPSRVWRFRSIVVGCSKSHPQCIEIAIPQDPSQPETISPAIRSPTWSPYSSGIVTHRNPYSPAYSRSFK